MLADGKLYEELWLASDAALLRELIVGPRARHLRPDVGCLATAGSGRRVEATDEYRRLYSEGWPLKVVFHGERRRDAGSGRWRGWSVARFPSAEFTPPAGFAAAPLLEVFGRAAP